MPDRFLLENGTDKYLLENGTDFYLLEDGRTTTWNPSAKSTLITLSNGDMDATGTTSGGTAPVIATTGKTTGKHYFEVSVTNERFFAGQGVGIASSLPADGVIPGSATNTHISYHGNSAVYRNSGNDGGGTQAVWEDGGRTYVIGVAFDADADKVWFSLNGVFAGDPAAGTGGHSPTGITTYYPMFFAGSSDIGRIRTTEAGFLYSVPSGFSAFDAAATGSDLVASGTGAFSAAGQSSAVADFAAAGTGTAALTGASTAAAVFSAAGTGSASMAGVGAATGVFAASGTGAFAGVGAALGNGVLAASGTGVFAGAGLADAAASFSAAGVGAFSAAGASAAAAVFGASGNGVLAGIGAATADAVFSASGVGAFTIASEAAASALTASATGTASFAGASSSLGVLAASGTGSAAFAGETAGTSVFAAAASATVALVGEFATAGTTSLHGVRSRKDRIRGKRVVFEDELPPVVVPVAPAVPAQREGLAETVIQLAAKADAARAVLARIEAGNARRQLALRRAAADDLRAAQAEYDRALAQLTEMQASDAAWLARLVAEDETLLLLAA